jgi:hypothetical protein
MQYAYLNINIVAKSLYERGYRAMMGFLSIVAMLTTVIVFSYITHQDKQKRMVEYVARELLGKPLTNQNVRHYIEVIQTAKEENRAIPWRWVRDGYRRIMNEQSVDPKLKRELKRALRNQVLVLPK